MQIIHSLTAVRISDVFSVDIPTYHLHLPLTKNTEGNSWIDTSGNEISPSHYMQEQMSIYGFKAIDFTCNQEYFKLTQRNGAWDICGVQDDQVLFASIIQNDEEILNREQIEWLRVALQTGLSIENFALIEVEKK